MERSPTLNSGPFELFTHVSLLCMLLQQAGWIATDLTVTLLALDSSCNNGILKYVLIILTTARLESPLFSVVHV